MSSAVSLRNYQFDGYPLNITFPNALYQSLAKNSSKLLASYVQDRIRKEMPLLYPLYERVINSEVSFDHYHRLREAEQCIQARLDCLPLPVSFKTWSVIHPIVSEIDVSAILGADGHQIFHWEGEPRESLALRLAFRQDPKAYMPVSVDPLIRLLGSQRLPFRDGMITGWEVGGRSIYLLGEQHGSKDASSIRERLSKLLRDGKIAWWSEGTPFHSKALKELKTTRQLPNDRHWFGLEHLGYYSLTLCLQNIQDSSVKILNQVYWYLNWTQKGREIWQKLADTYNRTQSELLKTAFVGRYIDTPINKSLKKKLSIFDGLQLWPRLGKLILDHYPSMYLREKEKDTLSFCLTHRLYEIKLPKCINLLVNWRDAIFADAVLSQLKKVPANLPVVVTIGMHHLYGLLRQIQAQSIGQNRTVDNWRHYGYVRNFAYRLKFAERLVQGCDK